MLTPNGRSLAIPVPGSMLVAEAPPAFERIVSRQAWEEPVAAIRIVTMISAPLERCFDLARDIDFHIRSLADTGERAVAGRTTGLIGLGESVTWEARHLGLRQRFTAKATGFHRPRYLRDVRTAR